MIRGMELKDIEAKVDAVKPEEMSLTALIETVRRAQDAYTRLARSAYEIGRYNLSWGVSDFAGLCDEAIGTKSRLEMVLLTQASCYMSLMMKIDTELDKRLETLND